MVCRRWRQAADGGAEVWGAAALRRPRGGTAAPAQPRIPLDGAFGVLRRQRAHLRRLHLDEGALQGGGTDAGMLAAALQAACGPGSGLTDLTIQGDPHPAVTQALPGGAAQLTALTLRALPGRGTAALGWDQLAHLTHLSSLAILSVKRLDASPKALGRLTALTRLRLSSKRHSQAEVAPLLLACSPTLQRLELVCGTIDKAPLEGSPAVVPTAEAQQQPAHLHLAEPPAASYGGSLQGPSLAAALAERWGRLEAMRLQEVHVAHAAVLQVLPTLRCLTSLHLAPLGCDAACVEVAQRCTGLQELVLGRYSEARLPELPTGALGHLTRLRVSGTAALVALPDSWCALPNLQSFEVESCERLRRLPAALAGITQLERLLFSHQRMERLPSQLTGLSQLTRLAVAACSLHHLPPGPYLHNLRELVLFANSLSCVPPALGDAALGAACLTRLDLSSNYSHHLSAADIEVLRHLSLVETLDLRRQEYGPEDRHPPELLAQLRAVLPRCDVLA
ncbi:leucine rich repeat [Micractinium conductrix]|uniref:Leucine rich repeat n=1 Tax=Micractinium conductrix TaxID=554055 RepID=A0A2P6VE72_9CHLO|nr:leucine rich repeat [Micractinium conductrix]|eukprot:PSC72367.1 leucine rich repeat [Micractinium conductrix]